MDVNDFFDKVGKNISGSINNISTGYENKKALDEKRNERDRIYRYIGMEAYNLYMEGKLPPSELDIHFENLKAVNTDINNIEREIEKQKNKNRNNCGYCGAELSFDSKFCPRCGRAVNQINDPNGCGTVPRIEIQNKVCVCGAVIPPDSTICMECGRRADKFDVN